MIFKVTIKTRKKPHEYTRVNKLPNCNYSDLELYLSNWRETELTCPLLVSHSEMLNGFVSLQCFLLCCQVDSGVPPLVHKRSPLVNYWRLTSTLARRWPGDGAACRTRGHRWPSAALLWGYVYMGQAFTWRPLLTTMLHRQYLTPNCLKRWNIFIF